MLKVLDLHQKPNFQFKINIKEISDTFDQDLYLNASNLYEQIKLIWKKNIYKEIINVSINISK